MSISSQVSRSIRNQQALRLSHERSEHRSGRAVLAGAIMSLTTMLATVNPAAAQDKPNVISFDLHPNPQTIDCLRANYNEEPRAHATVIRGKLNDTLILDLDGIKPDLAFDLFTVQQSPFLADGTHDPAFTGSFGLAWYQSDIHVGRRTDDGHVRISTILLDQIFGFDPDVRLAPTNTFHLGFWFNNIQDVVGCGVDPKKTTPFNGEHKAGPFAMISRPEQLTKLGPLCSDPNLSTKPVTCNP
jgi:hypothetical protein